MDRLQKTYIAGLVVAAAFALAATSLCIPIDSKIAIGLSPDSAQDTLLGVAFWSVITLVTSALPLQLPRGSLISTCTAPILGAMTLGGPTAAGWVALLGTTEWRELTGRVKWYGTLFNHAGLVLPAVLGGVATNAVREVLAITGHTGMFAGFVATGIGGAVYILLNLIFVATIVGLNSGQSPRAVIQGDAPTAVSSLVALTPLAWLMAQVYRVSGMGWWATLLFGVPIYLVRATLQRVVEMRHMFTQTIGALAEAVESRDPFTSNHSRRVMEIATDIGRVMRLPERELEALEWGGLLHDIGKIGVPDNVLLKQDRLTKEERTLMNRHPVIGATIVAKVERLAPELPIIRHHHEWYNGSGYPDRLIGEEIPKLARVLHVADSFEAMIAQRPYRMRPLTTDQAIAELRKYSGIQFDPIVVDAFLKTEWAKGIGDYVPPEEPRQIPTIGQAAARLAPSEDPHAPGAQAPGPPAAPADETQSKLTALPNPSSATEPNPRDGEPGINPTEPEEGPSGSAG